MDHRRAGRPLILVVAASALLACAGIAFGLWQRAEARGWQRRALEADARAEASAAEAQTHRDAHERQRARVLDALGSSNRQQLEALRERRDPLGLPGAGDLPALRSPEEEAALRSAQGLEPERP